MAAGALEVRGSIDDMAAVSEENAASVEEVSASTQEMSAQVEEMVVSAESLVSMADELRVAIASFKIAQDQNDQAEAPVMMRRRKSDWEKPGDVEKLADEAVYLARA